MLNVACQEDIHACINHGGFTGKPVIAQFVDGRDGYKIEVQIGVTQTYPTQCHLDGKVLSL